MFVHSKESVLVTYSVTDKTSRMPAKSIQEPCFSVRVCVCVCVCVSCRNKIKFPVETQKYSSCGPYLLPLLCSLKIYIPLR